MTVWSLGAAMDAPKVEAILAAIDEANAGRQDFTPAIKRDRAASAISAIMWAYGCRSSDTSAAYAYMALWQALGIDWFASTIVPLAEPVEPESAA
jgi:hypothetical protein